MTIKIGDSIPQMDLHTMTDDGPKAIATNDIFKGKKVVLFAVPGAFTPGCSNTHMPGFIVHADNIKAKGVDTIACVSVNDAFVMGAWGKTQNAEHLLLLADGSAQFTKALGLELDLSDKGLGVRSKRYSMIVEDGKVTALNVEPSGAGIDNSTAEKILEQL
ncbi:MAG: peroxiredoxin [Porticoccaceae bacterium]|nr:peroxiredoxin [Porticoccaceae bacterium]